MRDLNDPADKEIKSGLKVVYHWCKPNTILLCTQYFSGPDCTQPLIDMPAPRY